VRRGAASYRAVLGSCHGGGQDASTGAVTAEPSWVAERPGAVTWVSRAAQRVVAGARMSGRRPGRSLPCPRPGPAVGRPSSRSSGHPTSRCLVSGVRCPVSRRPLPRRPVSRCPDGQASAVRGTAAARSASRWTWSGWVWGAAPLGPVGRGGPRCPRAGGRLPASGVTGSDGAAVGRARAAPRSTVVQGRRLAGVVAAAPPGRRADMGLVQGQGVGRVGEPGTQQVLTGPPAGRLGGRRRGARPWAWTRRW
jgi:hypothetical protein